MFEINKNVEKYIIYNKSISLFIKKSIKHPLLPYAQKNV